MKFKSLCTHIAICVMTGELVVAGLWVGLFPSEEVRPGLPPPHLKKLLRTLGLPWLGWLGWSVVPHTKRFRVQFHSGHIPRLQDLS